MLLSRFRFVSAITVASLFVGGCGDGRDIGRWAGRADTLASGTVVVTNPSTPLWSASETWQIEETLRVGEMDGTGPTVFGGIGPIEAGRNGTIYVFDSHARELRIFAADGRHLRTQGRRGAGPGEFQTVIGMRIAPSGELWLVDAANGRYTVMHEDGGTPPESVRRPVTTYRVPWLGGFDRQGVFHDQATERVGGESVDLVLRLGADGEPTARFPLPAVALPVPRLGTMEFPLPFGARVLRAWDPHPAVLQAVSSEYRIARVRLSGDTVLVVSRAVEPRPLTAAQRDSVDTYLGNLASEFQISVPAESRPTRISPLRWFLVDDEEHLWVCATGADPCGALDVFDPAGRFLGTVALPTSLADTPRPVIRGGHLYAATEGAQGEPQVFAGRIIRP